MQKHQEHSAPQSDRSSTPAVLVGLFVVWLALFIVFKANEMSTVGVKLGKTNFDGNAVPATKGIPALDPRSRLLLPAEMHLPNLTPRQAVKRLATDIDLRIADAELARLDNNSVVNQDLPEDSVMMIMHRLINNGGLAVALSGDRLKLLPQQLDMPGPGIAQWRARVMMDQPEISVSPLADDPLWFTLRLLGAEDLKIAQRRTVQLEVWHGKNAIGSTRAKLNDKGEASFELLGSEKFRMTANRLIDTTSSTLPCFDLKLEYQSPKLHDGRKGK